MAQTFNVPNQNISFKLPEIGEVFKDTTGVVYKRTGDASIQTLSREAAAAGGLSNVNASALPAYNLGDVFSAISSIHNVPANAISKETSDTSIFANYAPPPITNEVFTSAASPTNPNARVITSNLKGVLPQRDAAGNVIAEATPSTGAIVPGAGFVNPNKPGPSGGPGVKLASQTTTTGLSAAPVYSPATLYSNQRIDALEKKITEDSAKLSAGIAAGGATAILSDLYKQFGIAGEQSLVNEYNRQILETSNRLKQLPDDIKNTLENVGISESQYNRIVVKETQKPLETLKGLMEQKGAAEDRINASLRFVGQFYDAGLKDQAAKLEAAKFDIETNKDMLESLISREEKYAELSLKEREVAVKEKKDILDAVLEERKRILTYADTAIKNGASQAVVNAILTQTSSEAAASSLAGSGFGDKPEASYKTEQVGSDVYQYQVTSSGQVVPGSAVKVIQGETKNGADDYNLAREIIELNPNASEDELTSGIMEKTKLSIGEVKTLLDSRGPVLDDDTLSTIGRELVKQNTGLFAGGDVQKAKDYINTSGKIDVNGKQVTLSSEQRKKIVEAIDTQYSGGERSFWQMLIPGGK